MRMLDNERHQYRSQATLATVICLILAVTWVMLLILPYFTIQLHYNDPASIEAGLVNRMRVVYGIANAFFIVTFLTQQCASQQGPSDEELEPESDDDGIDTDEEDLEDETAIEDGTTVQN